ncbi:MAG: Levanase [Subtercola sp.]|nr:Levanase [Subtercola sp.]
MTIDSTSPRPKARRRLVALAISLAAVLAAAPFINATPPAQATPNYRSVYHFTVPDGWKNDPQRPIYVNGQYQYYYLYNESYPPIAGTSWRMATSTDGVVWADQGVAASKDDVTNSSNGDLWSGSTVVDTNNTAGFGAGAVVMLVTQPNLPTGSIANQAEYLWYSTDGGRNFTHYSSTPVLANPGVADFRDPKVMWDSDRSQWVMTLAQGQTLGFYTSPNLKNWTYAGAFTTSGIGTVECPDLYKIRADDGTTKWVLAASANATAINPPTSYAYWTGTFTGTGFTPDSATPQWLDYGYDWYAAVTWEDAAAPLDQRFAVGWMNNWAYPDNTPTWTNNGYNGTDSVTRQIKLKKYGSVYSLTSQPVAALQNQVSNTTDLGTISVNGSQPLSYHGTAYELDADVSWTTANNIGLQLRRSSDGSRHADIGVYAGAGGYSYLNRGPTVQPDTSNQRVESRASFDMSKGTVHLKVLVDTTSIEVFIDDGRVAQSSLAFPDPSDNGIALYAAGGTASFSNVTIKDFAAVPQRPAQLVSDFEGTSFGAGWTTTGSYVGQAPVNWATAGKVNAKYADTFVNGADSATGSITSPSFVLDRNFVRFKLAGGNHPQNQPNPTSVQLLVNGTIVKTQTGNNSGDLSLYSWDVSAYAGQNAQFQILDQNTGGWGHIMVDQVTLSD